MYSTRYLLLVLTVALLALPPAASTSGRAQVAAPAAANIDSWNIDQVGHLGGGNGGLPAIVQAPYIYTAFGQELAVLDFSDPARPTRLAYIMLPQSIVSM